MVLRRNLRFPNPQPATDSLVSTIHLHPITTITPTYLVDSEEARVEGLNFYLEAFLKKKSKMALRRFFGFSDGELMRSDSKPCSRLMRHTAGVFSVGGALGFWILCRLHYGPRVNVPRSLRWASTGAVTVSAGTALLVRLFSPECEPQNIEAYDKKKK